MRARIVSGVVALSCLLIGGLLASHYPIYPAGVVAGFLLWIVLNYRWPFAWLIAVPALLPISGLATWTGWFAFEELDLLVLGAAAGGYAKLASLEHRRSTALDAPTVSSSGPAELAVIVFALSCTVSLVRGIADAGGFDFDWYGSYNGAMNSIRLCKSLALALLLWPLLERALRADEQRATRMLGGGLALGLGGAALAAVWERAAFTDLFNFSSDYRTTAFFWEMHVGGAAFDGFLALATPFVVWELRRRESLWHLGVALGLAALAVYASLTTFSRDVYLAIPAGFAVLAMLLTAQRHTIGNSAATIPFWRVAVLAAIATGAFFLVFREGGYRALGALLVTLAVALTLESASGTTTWAHRAIAVAAGLFIGALGALLAMIVPKGPYVIFAFAFFCNLGLFLVRDATPTVRSIIARWTGFVWLAFAAATVALHWGGAGAFADSSLALVVLVALAMGNSKHWKPWLADSPRSRAIWLASAALLAAAVAVFTGGAYMSDRFSTTSEDLEARLRHWKDGIGLLRGSGDWWLGKGTGRFPANYFFSAADRTFPGSYSLHQSGGEHFLSLAGPRYPTSWGDLFRVAQRVSLSPGIYTANFELRTSQDLQIHLEICEQHLLYNAACAASASQVRAAPGWQRVSVGMDGRELAHGPWYAPRLAFFALAVESSGRSVDVRSVDLIGPNGQNLIVNGNFADGMARWIPISERLHLPWHIKNVALNVLFDQGLAGLAAFGLLLAVALWRLAFGDARNHPLAPFLAASVVGFMVVGIFDSLLDVPRVAFLFYLLLLASLVLPRGSSPRLSFFRVRGRRDRCDSTPQRQ